jgi:hypothetical protein
MGMQFGPWITKPDMFPVFYPWCGLCGFQHQDDEHCPGCTGDHSAGFCMTAEVAEELAKVDLLELRRRVEQSAAEVLRIRDGV